MTPFAIEMNFTVDAVDLEAAVEIHDDVLAFAERHGFNFEGGSVALLGTDPGGDDTPTEVAA